MSWNFPLLFFLLLIPLSGFIAWAGDRVGHRIGKRRHTLLGLRPRHTATLTTIAAGTMIALVSFGLMWASNATFRMVLRDGAALYERNRALNRTNRQLQRDVAALRDLDTSQRRAVEQSQAARAAAQSARQQAETRLDTAQAQEKAARRRLETATADLAGARGNLQTTRAQLRVKEERVASAQSAARQAEKRRSQAETSARVARSNAADAQQKVADAERTLASVSELIRERTDRSEAELARLNRELAQRRTEMGQSLTSTTALRRNKITYQADEEVERTALPAGKPLPEIQKALWRLLEDAARKASARGAAALSGERAVVILPKPVAMSASDAADGPTGDMILDETGSVATAAEVIESAKQDVAVLIVASANAVVGEPVPVEFQILRNPRVLQQGAKLGEITLDGTQPQKLIADRLYAFLKGEIRKRLIEAGVIPPSLGDPDDVGAGQESIVSLSSDRWFQLLDDVRQAGPTAHVVVRAASDLRAADPVALTFDVNAVRDASARP